MSKAAYEKLVREYMETAETEFKLDESDKSKHVQRGLLLLDQLIAIRPREPVWVFRKAFQLLLLRREHDALVTLEALRGVSKWPLHVHLVKTICLQRLARHGEAVEAAERALHADPDCRVSQRLKAFSLYCSGRIQEAREFATVLSFLPEGRAPLRSEQEYMALLGAEIHGFDAYMIHASGRSAQASAYFKTHRVKSSSEVVWRTMFFLEQGDFLAASQSQTTLRLLKNEKQERVISQCARIFCSFPVQTADTLYAQGLFEKIRCNSRDAITYLFRATQDAHGAPSAVAASARRALHHTALLNFCLASNHAASESPDKYPLVPWCHAVYSTLGLENLFSTLTPMPVDSPIFQTFYNETKGRLTHASVAVIGKITLLSH
jgi:tetratricopeptide (TPR) repeat protein